jgi:lipopolysaccharide export system permease protein
MAETLPWDSLYASYNPNDPRIMETAINSARAIRERIRTYNTDFDYRERKILRHDAEWHRKFTLSFACLVLFFIGAPLGAIIRKGGLGMPVVFSIIFFVIFHVISITGEKFVKEGVIPAWQGMWIASAILLPIGTFLTIKATTDAPLLDAEAWRKNINNIAGLINKLRGK